MGLELILHLMFFYAKSSLMRHYSSIEACQISNQQDAGQVMKKLIIAVFMTIGLASFPVWAQGTTAQRAGCENDAKKWCPYAIPDPDEVQACLEKVLDRITPDCQAQFGYNAGKPKKR
jgi:hypothetical protein